MATAGCRRAQPPPEPPTSQQPINPPGQPPVVTNPLPPLEPLSSILPNGVTGRWKLADGTELVEGTIGETTHCYARYYPKEDAARFVLGDASDATVKDIFDDHVVFIGTKSAPNAVVAFPYLLDYRLSDSALAAVDAYLPLTSSVKFGAPQDGTHRVMVTSVAAGNSDVSVAFDQLDAAVAPSVSVRAIADRYEIVISVPDVAMKPGLELSAPAYGKDGLILSVSIQTGDAGTGLTIVVAVNPARWSSATFNCKLSYGTERLLKVNLFGDHSPTSLTPSVKR